MRNRKPVDVSEPVCGRNPKPTSEPRNLRNPGNQSEPYRKRNPWNQSEPTGMSNPNRHSVSETPLLRSILLALQPYGVFWRNNSGMATHANGHPVRFGLTRGAADIIGLRHDGRFVAIEVKTKTGRVSKPQDTFLCRVRECNGIAGVARTPEEAIRITMQHDVTIGDST